MTMQVTRLKCVVALLLLCSSAAMADKQYKSPEEHELYSTITKDFAAGNIAKVLAGLDTWKQKFAESDFASNRQQLYVQAYARANQPAKAIEAAKPALAGPFDTPDDQLRLLYTVVTAVQQLPSPGAELRPVVSDAARQLKAFDKPPATMKAEEWQKAKATLDTAASVAELHVTLTPIREAIQAKDCAKAEPDAIKAVQEFPEAVQAAWVLASAQLCLARTTPAKLPPALYMLARASALDATKGLADPAWQASTATPYFEKLYTQYRGSDPEGMRQLKTTALASPLPPADFQLASANEIEQQKQADFESKHPELAMWMRVKAALTAADGTTYFASQMKDAETPPLVGTVVDARPACKPTQLKVAVSKPGEAEVLLKLSAPLAGRTEPGSEFRFQGVATAFAREPFLLTMTAETDRITGLKTSACSTPASSGPAKSRRRPIPAK